MNIRNLCRAIMTVVVFAPFNAATISADEVSALDAARHPSSPPRERFFVNRILPLDVKLSWTERFNGDETFNSDQGFHTDWSMMMNDPAMARQKAVQGRGGAVDGTGVVKGIRAEQGKVKIAHGPIEKFGMPAMTMMFKVEDAAMLRGLENDQEVAFNVENTSGGFVVTRIGPIRGMEGISAVTTNRPGMDARGIVKSVRPSQGKVRIEHAPIDKFGMPSMTMVFKVKDPTMLEGLKKGLEVEFDVNNSPGGFEITHIRPVR